MEDLTNKVTLSKLRADEFIQPMAEIQKVITESGRTLTNADVNQLYKSIGATVTTKALALAMELVDGKKVFITSPDGGEFTMRAGAPAGTYDDDSVLSAGTRFTSGDGSSGIERDNVYRLNVQWYGAIPDSVTNNITFFNEAKARARLPANNGHSAIYVPAAHDRKYYRIDETFVLDTDSLTLSGDGISSIIVIHSATGDNAITVSGNAHRCQIRDIAIMGIAGSGNGIEITSTSHYGEIRSVYIGYMGGVGLKVTSGQSWSHIDINVDQNGGYAPTTIVGASAGNCTMAFYIAPDPNGNTNNQSFINCRSNGIGVDAPGNYALKVGDAGSPVQITTFSWVGGVVQGTANNELVYIKCDEPHITNTHLESTSTATEYIITIDGSRNCNISDSFILGDINISGINKFLKLSDISGVGGISIANATANSTIKNIIYRNNTNGPSLGNISYTGDSIEFDNVTSLNGDQSPIPGEQVNKLATRYYGSSMEDWLGGASPTVPVGFNAGGGGTVTRDTGTVRTGQYSTKIVYTATNTQGLRLNLVPLNAVQGKKVTVVAWVYVTAGVARVRLLESGTTSYDVDSKTTGVWERISITFIPIPSATSVRLLFTAADATTTVFWDSIDIYVEDYVHIIQKNDAAGTINVSADNTTEAGYLIPLIFASGGTAITAINGGHVGKPFMLYFDTAKTVNNTANIKLAGGVNFAATANDTLTLVLCEDGLFREIGRSVN